MTRTILFSVLFNLVAAIGMTQEPAAPLETTPAAEAPTEADPQARVTETKVFTIKGCTATDVAHLLKHLNPSPSFQAFGNNQALRLVVVGTPEELVSAEQTVNRLQELMAQIKDGDNKLYELLKSLGTEHADVLKLKAELEALDAEIVKLEAGLKHYVSPKRIKEFKTPPLSATVETESAEEPAPNATSDFQLGVVLHRTQPAEAVRILKLVINDDRLTAEPEGDNIVRVKYRSATKAEVEAMASVLEQMEKPDVATPAAQSDSSTTPTAQPQSVIPNLLKHCARLRVTTDGKESKASGTIIESGGETIVLTCSHIFWEMTDQTRIEVELFDSHRPRTYVAKLLGYSLQADVALIQFDTSRENHGSAKIAPLSLNPSVGNEVISIGCIRGESPTSSTRKIVHVNQFIGADNLTCTGQPEVGEVGGGLFNDQGQLIGVCTAADAAAKRGVYCGLGPIHELIKRYEPAHLDDATAKTLTPSPSPGGRGEPEGSASVKVFALQHAQATEVAEILKQVYDQGPSKIVPDVRTNSVIVTGPDAQVQEIEALLLKLDEADGNARVQPKARVVPLETEATKLVVQLQDERAKLLQTLGPEHPKVKELQARIDTARKSAANSTPEDTASFSPEEAAAWASMVNEVIQELQKERDSIAKENPASTRIADLDASIAEIKDTNAEVLTKAAKEQAQTIAGLKEVVSMMPATLAAARTERDQLLKDDPTNPRIRELDQAIATVIVMERNYAKAIAAAESGVQPSSSAAMALPATDQSPKELQQQLTQLRKEYEAADAQAHQLAVQLQQTPDEAKKAELQKTVQRAFTARQSLLRTELLEMQTRLLQTQRSIEMRERISDQIIQRRVEDLMNPQLKWEGETAPGQPLSHSRRGRSETREGSREFTSDSNNTFSVTPDGKPLKPPPPANVQVQVNFHPQHGEHFSVGETVDVEACYPNRLGEFVTVKLLTQLTVSAIHVDSASNRMTGIELTANDVQAQILQGMMKQAPEYLKLVKHSPNGDAFVHSNGVNNNACVAFLVDAGPNSALLAKLQGAWEIKWSESDSPGEKAPADLRVEGVIEKNLLRIWVTSHGKRIEAPAYQLQLGQPGPPQQIDMIFDPNGGDQRMEVHGIIEIKDDFVQICVDNSSDSQRPEVFAVGQSAELWELRRPAQKSPLPLGVELSPTPVGREELKGTVFRGGLRIKKVLPGTLAETHGLKAGDILIGLGTWETVTVENVNSASQFLGKQPLKFYIRRAGQTLYGEFPVEGQTPQPVTQLTPLPSESVLRLINPQRPAGRKSNRQGLHLGEPVSLPTNKRFTGGLAIESVQPGSPADRGGIQAEDILVGLGTWETPVLEHAEFILEQQHPQPLRFYIVRNGDTFSGHLSEGPPAADRDKSSIAAPAPDQPETIHTDSQKNEWAVLGIKLAFHPHEDKPQPGQPLQGVFQVESIRPDGPAAKSTLRIGDILEELGPLKITSPVHVEAVLREFNSSRLSYTVVRDGKSVKGTFRVPLNPAANREPTPVEEVPIGEAVPTVTELEGDWHLVTYYDHEGKPQERLPSNRSFRGDQSSFVRPGYRHDCRIKVDPIKKTLWSYSKEEDGSFGQDYYELKGDQLILRNEPGAVGYQVFERGLVRIPSVVPPATEEQKLLWRSAIVEIVTYGDSHVNNGGENVVGRGVVVSPGGLILAHLAGRWDPPLKDRKVMAKFDDGSQISLTVVEEGDGFIAFQPEKPINVNHYFKVSQTVVQPHDEVRIWGPDHSQAGSQSLAPYADRVTVLDRKHPALGIAVWQLRFSQHAVQGTPILDAQGDLLGITITGTRDLLLAVPVAQLKALFPKSLGQLTPMPSDTPPAAPTVSPLSPAVPVPVAPQSEGP